MLLIVGPSFPLFILISVVCVTDLRRRNSLDSIVALACTRSVASIHVTVITGCSRTDHVYRLLPWTRAIDSMGILVRLYTSVVRYGRVCMPTSTLIALVRSPLVLFPPLPRLGLDVGLVPSNRVREAAARFDLSGCRSAHHGVAATTPHVTRVLMVC